MLKAAASPVRASFSLWMLALVCGMLETTLVIAGGEVSGTELLTGVTIRAIVTFAAVYVAARMLAGRNWARLTLASVLGVAGTLSLIVEPIRWLAAGKPLADLMDPLFATSRLIHTVAVLAATVLMFVPAANAHFRGGRSVSSNP